MFHDFLQLLVSLDRILFEKVNHDWVNSTMDHVMPFVTDFHNTRIFLFAAVLLWIFAERTRALKVLFGCVLAVGLSDIVAARVIKPLVHRTRPDVAESHVRLLVPLQRAYGFPSNHAANVFSAAMYLGSVVPGMRIAAWSIAALVSYSRVYVGVHYPGDVIAGAILGVMCALVILSVWTDAIRRKPAEWTRRLTKRYRPRQY